ncbi:uncharacterized protein LOC135695676 [Rhopilema esculentum]|uniref:uncharacterized protein LOC135695676 n=1 Tax=Rhopilema esculentum TaxID=499914 RepID=UPI0031E45AB4
MRELYDTIETHFRGLEALGVDQDSYATIIVPTLMEKIPEPIRLNMIRGTKNFEEWDIETMLASFRHELNVREQNFSVLSEKPVTKRDDGFKPRQPTKTSASALLSGNEGDKNWKKACAYCFEDHKELDCSKVQDIEERKKIILHSGRCFCCLKKGHRASKCRVKVVCKFCKFKHHSSICTRNNNSVLDKTSPKPSAPPNLISTTSCVEKVDSGGRAALQTAQAIVVGKPQVRARVLFDTGSDKTFVTRGLVDHLALKPIRREPLGIKTFGSNNVDEGMREIVEIKLLPVRGEGSAVKLNAFVVDHISEISNVHPEIVKHEYAHLANVWFSDVACFQNSLEVDILIGIDFFHEFQEDKVIRGKA